VRQPHATPPPALCSFGLLTCKASHALGRPASHLLAQKLRPRHRDSILWENESAPQTTSVQEECNCPGVGAQPRSCTRLEFRWIQSGCPFSGVWTHDPVTEVAGEGSCKKVLEVHHAAPCMHAQKPDPMFIRNGVHLDVMLCHASCASCTHQRIQQGLREQLAHARGVSCESRIRRS
jgi:hypothetical protein